jgi:hypothetical protein
MTVSEKTDMGASLGEQHSQNKGAEDTIPSQSVTTTYTRHAGKMVDMG